MKCTKKFYKELVEEIKFRQNELERVKKAKERKDNIGTYDYAIGLYEGMIKATKAIVYKLYPVCELDKDLKQGH